MNGHTRSELPVFIVIQFTVQTLISQLQYTGMRLHWSRWNKKT